MENNHHIKQQMANAIRILSVDTLVKAKEGHPGTPCGGADIATALYADHIKINPNVPDWPDRDRFVHSAGHGSMLVYALQHLCGFSAIDTNALKNFRVLGSKTPGHPEYDIRSGIETTTGPLGQGIANAVGMAVTESMINAKFGSQICHHYTYAYVGDGCLMEGVAAEVIALAGHFKLGKLIFFWDDNQMTDDGDINIALSDDVIAHFKASKWHVQNVDGHDIEAISQAISNAKQHSEQPSLIACKTIIGKGIPRVQGTRAAHGQALIDNDAQDTRDYLKWTENTPFRIPEEVTDAWHNIAQKGEQQYLQWQQRFNQLSNEDKAIFEQSHSRQLDDEFNQLIIKIKKQKLQNPMAEPTIIASAQMCASFAEVIPFLLTGAPDLEGTTQHKQNHQAYTADNYLGRYIHYGVREHAMGSMINGMVLHKGIIPIGATYLVFSDYMRPSIRMAALMKIPSVFVFSHDSIGIGSNGATHQPVEILASLRAIPNLWTLRAADGIELAECWQLALNHTDGPSAIICSRQPIELFRQNVEADVNQNLSSQGAYFVIKNKEKPDVTILATGSEVGIAISSQRKLIQHNIKANVVSMPCWELFNKQSLEYQDAILGDGNLCVAIEAAVRLGWDQYIGRKGIFIGMDQFGESGQPKDLYEHFKITDDRVVELVLERLKR